MTPRTGLEEVQSDDRHWKRSIGKTGVVPLVCTVESSLLLPGFKYHFIFPAPAGDIRRFWEEYPDGPDPIIHSSAWLLDQCYRISETLVKTLAFQRTSTHLRFIGHGDLDQNKLWWFRSSIPSVGVDSLSLSLFGTSPEQDLRLSMWSPPKNQLDSKFSIQDFHYSSSGNIWGLGCAFFELAVWFLEGLAGIEELSRLRALPIMNVESDADCYHYIERYMKHDHQGNLRAEERPAVKPAVKELVEGLQSNENCPVFLIELLTFISWKMWEGDWRIRASPQEVYEKMLMLQNLL